MNQIPIYIQMVVKLIDTSIIRYQKDIDTLENLPNYNTNKDFEKDVIHLQGRITGLENLKKKIDVLF